MSKVQGNLTEGPILKVLTKLALPIMASAFLGTAYNITDMAWIGRLGSVFCVLEWRGQKSSVIWYCLVPKNPHFPYKMGQNGLDDTGWYGWHL